MSEICPFCKNEILTGAVVCSGCGARKKRADASGALLFFIGGVISMVIGVKFSSHDPFSSEPFLWGLAAAIFGAIAFKLTIKRKPFWDR